jgi:hypothetical protein
MVLCGDCPDLQVIIVLVWRDVLSSLRVLLLHVCMLLCLLPYGTAGAHTGASRGGICPATLVCPIVGEKRRMPWNIIADAQLFIRSQGISCTLTTLMRSPLIFGASTPLGWIALTIFAVLPFSFMAHTWPSTPAGITRCLIPSRLSIALCSIVSRARWAMQTACHISTRVGSVR